jgi:hypothetical protein
MRTPPPGPEWVHASQLRDVVPALFPAELAPEVTPQANQPQPPTGRAGPFTPLDKAQPHGCKHDTRQHPVDDPLLS